MSGADADADGDSQMRSSSDENDSESMFPSANEPTTPQNTSMLFQLQHAELSPPNSQDPPDQNGAIHQADLMDVGESHTLPSDSVAKSGGQMTTRGASTVDREQEQLPGYAWKNSKAMDEYHRALDQIVDKGFNLREFGDPFDERDTKASD